MKLPISKTLLLSFLIVALGSLYLLGKQAGTLQKPVTPKQDIHVLAPADNEELVIGSTYTIKWSPLKNLPDSAYLYARITDGSTSGVIIKEPFLRDNQINWKINTARADDILTPLKPGTYTLILTVYKNNFCDQATCWNHMLNYSQVPIIAQSKEIRFRLRSNK